MRKKLIFLTLSLGTLLLLSSCGAGKKCDCPGFGKVEKQNQVNQPA